MKIQRFGDSAAFVLAGALALSACGGQQAESGSGSTGTDGAAALSGSIASDGSSTVGPLTSAAADLFMPVSGEIVEVNEALRNDPSLANTDPMGSGWFFKVRVSDMAEFDQLMDPPGYDALLKTL